MVVCLFKPINGSMRTISLMKLARSIELEVGPTATTALPLLSVNNAGQESPVSYLIGIIPIPLMSMVVSTVNKT
jgi:hypothetical protein